MDLYERYREYYEYIEKLLNYDITLNITNINKKVKKEPEPIKESKKNQFNNIPKNNNKQGLINLESDNEIKDDVPKIHINKIKEEPKQININNINTEKTRESTYKENKIYSLFLRQKVKKTKIPYGEWIDYYTKSNKKNAIIKNKFLQNHLQINQDILLYFCPDSSKFLSHRAIEIKTVIADYGQKLINENIKDNEHYLYYISYKKFCEPLKKNFSIENYNKNLGELFIEYQENNEGIFENNNKNVVEYIRNNQEIEKEANDLLNLNYYNLIDYFVEFDLKNYLKKKEEELVSIYKTKVPFAQYSVIIKAFISIIETLCKEFKEYSESIAARKINKKPRPFSVKHPKTSKHSDKKNEK